MQIGVALLFLLQLTEIYMMRSNAKHIIHHLPTCTNMYIQKTYIPPRNSTQCKDEVPKCNRTKASETATTYNQKYTKPTTKTPNTTHADDRHNSYGPTSIVEKITTPENAKQNETNRKKCNSEKQICKNAKTPPNAKCMCFPRVCDSSLLTSTRLYNLALWATSP